MITNKFKIERVELSKVQHSLFGPSILNLSYLPVLTLLKHGLFRADETKVLVGKNDTFLSSPLIAMRSSEFTDVTLKIVDDVADVGLKPPLVKISVTSDSGFTFK